MEITLKNVSYSYKNKKLLNNINLKINSNKITGITGEYKTVLCLLIDAVKDLSSGNIIYDNIVLSKEVKKIIRRQVSMIHQNYKDQFFTDSLEEEVLFLTSCIDYHPKDLNKKMRQSLDIVGLDKKYLKRKISSLSCGEKRLIQIALALITNPSVIIFDEIFSELDYLNKKKIIKLIKLLKDKYKKTIIISTNDINLLYELTDDIIILKNGHVIIADNTIKVYQNVDLLRKNKLELPDLIKFTYLAKQKNVKLSYHRDVLDLIKDVYKHV